MATAEVTVLKQILTVALGLLLAGAMAWLGNWQLEVYRSSGNQNADAKAAAPALDLRSVAPAGSAVREGFGRSVRFEGRYDANLQVLVRSGGSTGPYRVLTGLRQADGSVVAVVRGVVSAHSAPAPPAGTRTQVGVLLPSEDDAAVTAPEADELDAVRLPVLAQRWSGQIVGGYVTLPAAASQSQGLTPAPLDLPEARGKLRNAAYALQWWLFGVFAMAMALRMARDFGRHTDARQDEHALDEPEVLARDST